MRSVPTFVASAICALAVASPAVLVSSAHAVTRAELGAMLKTCSDEADAKGLTVQKGKGEARKTYRRQCMMKKGVAPKSK